MPLIGITWSEGAAWFGEPSTRKTTVLGLEYPATEVKPLPVKDPAVVYPEPVEGHGLFVAETLIHATAPVPPAHIYPIGQGAH